MKRCVIVGGGEIKNATALKNLISKNDFFIYCDSGLNHKQTLGFAPNLVVGDFDSHQKPNCKCECIVLPCEKDDTDTVFALKWALNHGYTEFLITGVTGGRHDHTFASYFMLEYLYKNGARGVITDGATNIYYTEQSLKIASGCKYFSVFALCDSFGVDICGAKYNLNNKNIFTHYQYGISNEVMGEYATVSVKDGKLLIMVINDVSY